ncbi:unnamed protein product [Miscanthus lutarioriparius]|uniref:Uncharacterized protein n=1 Tax=Miscanthus lutarioriparius TaxID=422564 RepID=A0A811QCF6_9POAL|nr:unnamed protein product [Miscanthus lutarioriparius]
MERATAEPHFVLVPWQGGISHIIPMTDIGHLRASHGAAVTIIRSRVEDLATTKLLPLPPGAGPAGTTITVTAIPFPAAEAGGLPEGCERLDLLRSPADVPRFFAATSHFGEAVARYCRGSEAMLRRRRPSCVVAPMCHSWTLGLARGLGVACYIFHGFGAFALVCIEYLYKHRPQEAVSSADELVDIPVLPAFECRFLNERLIVDVLGVGVSVGVTKPTENVLSAGKLNRSIADVKAEGDVGEKRRRKAQELKAKANGALEKGVVLHEFGEANPIFGFMID